MVGGRVIEIIKLKEKIWINTVDSKRLDDRCAIYVERNRTSEMIQINDSLWWQSIWAFWTPYSGPLCGAMSDIKIKRVGFSGVKRPDSMVVIE